MRLVLDLAGGPSKSLGQPLAGLGAALIFEKPSNRTRQSTEMAVVQLGGHPVYTRGEEVGFDTREPVEDIARIMGGYHAVIAARVFDHAVVERIVAVRDVPVVNLLSDWSHPLQAITDALTMEQLLGAFAGKIVAWVGDYNNVARSLGEVVGCSVCTSASPRPPGFGPDDAELERLALLAVERSSTIAAGRGSRGSRRRAHRHVGVDGSGGRERGTDPHVRALPGDEELMVGGRPGGVPPLPARVPRPGGRCRR